MGGRAHLLARRPPRRKGTGTSGRPEREPPSQPVGALSVCVCVWGGACTCPRTICRLASAEAGAGLGVLTPQLPPEQEDLCNMDVPALRPGHSC